jgi:hypothetical protein
MKLQILVPQYKETEKIIKPLLNDIKIQLLLIPKTIYSFILQYIV